MLNRSIFDHVLLEYGITEKGCDLGRLYKSIFLRISIGYNFIRIEAKQNNSVDQGNYGFVNSVNDVN